MLPGNVIPQEMAAIIRVFPGKMTQKREKKNSNLHIDRWVNHFKIGATHSSEGLTGLAEKTKELSLKTIRGA